MELIILLPTILILEMGVEAWLTSLARGRGRVVTWNVSFTTALPDCADVRLNRIERFLRIIVAPLGVLLALVGVVVAFAADDTLGAILIILGFVLISLRGIFVAACFAYAELADAPPANSHA